MSRRHGLRKSSLIAKIEGFTTYKPLSTVLRNQTTAVIIRQITRHREVICLPK
jgi:hypothetical protein